MWGERADGIIGGDLTAALSYLTPAGGAVATPVAPIGMRDPVAGTVSFTTSLGFGKKLQRIEENPRVALAYHAREHGFASGEGFVLVQGIASYDANPDRDALEALAPAVERFMGPRQQGVFWDRWLSAYYADRVLVTVRLERVLSWPEAHAAGEAEVVGKPPPSEAPSGQDPPANGVGPRVDVERVARRIAKLPHLLLAYRGADGFPVVTPVSLGQTIAGRGLGLEGSLPPAGRRAGLLAHRYEPKLIGLEVRQYTGWLQDGIYAPHTEAGFNAPANKTILLLANGYMARRGLKRARARANAAS